MLQTETLHRKLPRSILAHRVQKVRDDDGLKQVKRHKRQYEKRKAAGLCTHTGCREKPDVGHTHCQKHLREMSKRNKEQYQKRMREGLCIYCGTRPGFWGIRCVICRQRFAKHPLPYGARQALRLYRQAEEQHKVEHNQIEARLAIRKLLASGDINGDQAKAVRLYAGVDDGRWRTYREIGKVMHISKERVRQLLLPSKLAVVSVLGDNVPWKPVA